jgi:glycosyltransferase involved in cell wall biosynthesis
MHPIAIGLPVYNGEAFLSQTLESLLSQTMADFELIISDNDSRDGTQEICYKYAKMDSRIKYSRTSRLIRPGENYNRTLHLSSSKYFKWAAHDDICEPTFLERCYQCLEEDPSVVLAYSKVRIIDFAGNALQDYTYKLNTDSSNVAERFGALVRANHRIHGAYEIFGLIRRETLESIPCKGNYARADSVVLARLSLRGKLYEIPETLFLSRDHSSRSVHAVPVRIGSGRTRLHEWIGTGPLPPTEWWDPAKKGKIDFPEWRIVGKYVSSVNDAPLSRAQRVQCMAEIAKWLGGSWPKLVRDLVIAGEQLVLGSPEARRV